MRFGQGLAFVFRESWAFMRKAWWLAIIPLVPVWAYNLSAGYIDERLGDILEWAAPACRSILAAALIYGVIRFLALGHDLRAALEVNQASARTFAPFLVTMALLDFVADRLPEVTSSIALWLAGWSTLLLVNVIFAPWIVTAPSGGTVIGPIGSAKLMLRCLFWGVCFCLVIVLALGLATVPLGWIYSGLLTWQEGSRNAVAMLWLTVQLPIGAYVNVALVAASYVIALKAGLRVNDTPTLASVFD